MRKAENETTERDLRNMSKVNETCYCEHVIIRLKCGSGCGSTRNGYGDKMRNGYG
jgi:hypothetical protein